MMDLSRVPFAPERALAAIDARLRSIAVRCDGLTRARETEDAFASAVAGLGEPFVVRPEPHAAVAPPALDRLIENVARERRLDPNLLRAVVSVESAGDPAARSAAGAEGLMQLMPGTARDLGVADPFDPVQNVRGGATYLRSLLDRFGDTRLALAAYNAGPEAVERARGVPPFAETRAYVERVTRVAADLAR